MIKVYFETNSYAELVAVFRDEDTYSNCLPALKKQAKKENFARVTESVMSESIDAVDEKITEKLA